MEESTDASSGGHMVAPLATGSESGVIVAGSFASPPVASLPSSKPEEEEEEVELHMKRNTNHPRSAQLYKAAIQGDWEKVRVRGEELSEHITQVSETILHVAVGQPNNKFVLKLVDAMTEKQLQLKDHFGRTALCSAAIAGNTEAARILVKKNKLLPGIMSNCNYYPLHYAAKYGHKKTIQYLLDVTEFNYGSKDDMIAGVTLLKLLMSADLFELAYDQLRKLPDHALEENISAVKDVFQKLAQKPSAFRSGNPGGYFERFIYNMIVVEKQEISTSECQNDDEENALTHSKISSASSGILQSCRKFFRKVLVVIWKVVHIFPYIHKVYCEKLAHTEALELLKAMCERVISCYGDSFKLLEEPVRTAAKLGIYEFVHEALSQSPELIWSYDEGNRHSIFHLAVLHRHEKIFSIIDKMFTYKHRAAALRDKEENNNILHLAGKLGPCSEVSGAALHMQRELQWFKEVEKSVIPAYKEEMNKSDKTPRMVFSEEHSELVKKGGKWIRNTASSCSIVASLIITTMFTAAVKFSGRENYGRSFIVFAAADAIGLVTSSTAVCMLLGILTSRCAEDDFLKYLPRRLMIGIVTLFVSIVAVMVAFGAILHILLFDLVGWVIIIPIAITTCLPITLFVKMQSPLIIDLVLCTYFHRVFY